MYWLVVTWVNDSSKRSKGLPTRSWALTSSFIIKGSTASKTHGRATEEHCDLFCLRIGIFFLSCKPFKTNV